MTSCETCGFDPRTITPPDAIATIRSLPRRYRSALGSVPDDDKHEQVLATTPPGEEHSPIGLVMSVADTLAAHAGVPSSGGTSSDDALRALESAATALADQLDEIKGEAWLEATDGATPQDRAHEAAHAGVHHLRQLPSLIDAAIRAATR